MLEPTPGRLLAAIAALAGHLQVDLDCSRPQQLLLAPLVVDLGSTQAELGLAGLLLRLDSAVLEDSVDSVDFFATRRTGLGSWRGFPLSIPLEAQRASLDLCRSL